MFRKLLLSEEYLTTLETRKSLPLVLIHVTLQLTSQVEALPT